MSDKKRFIYALAVYVGTVMGVGLFGLPYVGAKIGFWGLLIYLLAIGLLVIVVNIFYGEIAAKTKGLHRLPGYAEKYLGSKTKPFAFAVKTLAIFGSLLAYLIIGGQFLADLFGGPVYIYTFIFFIIGSLLIWKDKKSIGPVEFIMLFFFVIIIVLLFGVGLPKIDFYNLSTFNSKFLFAPYGVLLFSLWGASIVPEVKEELKGDLKKVKHVIIIGIGICIAIYILFSMLVIGISGENTAVDAISGMEGSLGQWALLIGYVFGIIATFTSFITLGLTVKKLFWYDYKLPKKLGWFLACFVPLGLYILKLRDFIDVIGITGAVMLGLDGIFIVSIYLKLKKGEKNKKMMAWKVLGTFLILFLATGVILEIYYFINGY